MGGLCRMECQGIYLRSPCKDSWFEVDWWVIKIINALGVAVHLTLDVLLALHCILKGPCTLF
jgi:hypothetical protein